MDDPGVPGELERLLSADYLAGIETADAPTLRDMRAECEVQEQRISYARRILQGRVDVLRAEARRRSDGTASGVMDLLSDVLADQGQRTFDPATARPPSPLDPSMLAEEADVAGPADLSGLDGSALESLAEQYAEQERTLSALRRQLFDVIDRIQAQVADRYRSGATSISELLERP